MGRRCVLLHSGGSSSGSPALELEPLPAGVLPRDILDQEHRYQASLAGGAQLHWRHHAALAGAHNPLASRLAQTHVCGDAVLVLHCESEADLRGQAQQLAARHLRGLEWRLAGWPAQGSSAGGSGDEHQQRRQRRRLEQRQEVLLRLLRRPAGAPAPTSPQPPAAGEAPAPATPTAQPIAAEPAAPDSQAAGAAASPPVLQHKPPQAQRTQPPAQQQQQRQQQRQEEHGLDTQKCEPRQQLLWQIAGRATSMSWQDQLGASSTAAAAKAPPPAAAAVPPTSPAAPSSAAAAAGADAAAPAAADAGECPLPAKHRSSLERSPWGDLQPELLAVVLQHAGHSSSFARGLSQVCAGWRRGLGEERAALQRLRFSRLEGPSSTRGAKGPLPWLVRQAAKAGNVAATVLAARWLEGSAAACGGARRIMHALAGTQYGPACDAGGAGAGAAGRGARRGGAAEEAARYWTRAAKLGHPEAQAKVGYAHYKALMGLPHDGEEAFLWLTRAAKQLGELLGVGPDPGAPAQHQRSGSAPQLPPLMSHADCRDTLAQAAHILGYLHLDGEGTRVDVGAALRWLRLAERHGCAEAGRVIGSLLNTGQY